MIFYSDTHGQSFDDFIQYIRKKARKRRAFQTMLSVAYESSFIVNGGDGGIRTLDAGFARMLP